MPHNPSKRTEEEIQKLVFASQKGDQDAFSDLYEHFVDLVYRYIYFKVDVRDVEDLTETVFVKVWANIRQYKPGKYNFSSWLFRIAHNAVVDHYRLNHSVEALVEDYQDHRLEHNPIHVTQQNVNADTLREALKELKEPYQQLVILKFMNHLSNEEISTVLGRSEGNLRILQYRALRALRKILEEKGVYRDGI